jgi:hypothetical protein
MPTLIKAGGAEFLAGLADVRLEFLFLFFS